jgi:hypothetical protein
MAYSDSTTLKAFLSYASEDKQIADALAHCLAASFGSRIDLRRMSTFPIGSNWRTEINEHIDRADLLIVIASGRLKAQHSFTGYEVGAFDCSRRKSSPMETYPHCSRVAIPFAVLSEIPETLSQFQGVGIDPESIFAIKCNGEHGTKAEYDEKIFDFLVFVEDLINKAQVVTPDWATMKARRQALEEQSHTLFQALRTALATRQRKTERPRSKLIIRMSPDSNGTDLSNAKIWIEGDNCWSAFGIEPPSTQPIDTSVAESMDWAQLTENVVGDDISAGWKMILEKVMSAAIKQEFIDDRLTSFDRKKTLRIFISKVVRFFNRTREFHIYVVDVLPPKKYGDADTALFQNALQVGLTYRSMFLEKTSQFGPRRVMAKHPAELPELVSKLLCELEYVLQFSRNAELDQPDQILRILGDDAAERINGMFSLWDTERAQLLAIAHKIVATRNGETFRGDFITQLKRFCEKTEPLNNEYLAAVMDNLQTKLGLNLSQTPATAPSKPGYPPPPTGRPDPTGRGGKVSVPASREEEAA